MGSLILDTQSDWKDSLILDGELKMADAKWYLQMLKMIKTRFLPKIYYSGIFGVTEHQYTVRLEKLFASRWPEIVRTNAKNAKNKTFTKKLLFGGHNLLLL